MDKLNVQQTLESFYQRNDFDFDGGVSKNIAWVKVGPLPLPILNLPSRKQALIYHDIHHITTAYETTLKGEAAISAWEIASGGWGRLWYVWIIVLSGFAMGVVFFPKTTRQAFQDGLPCKNAFASGIPMEALLKMDMEALQNAMKGHHGSAQYTNWAIFSVLLVISYLLMAIGLIFTVL